MEWAWPPTHREQQGAACPGAPLGHGNGVGSGWEFPKLLLVLRLEMGCSSCRGIDPTPGRLGNSTAQQGRKSLACTICGVPSGLGALEDPLLACIPKLAAPLFCQFVVVSRKTSRDRG